MLDSMYCLPASSPGGALTEEFGRHFWFVAVVKEDAGDAAAPVAAAAAAAVVAGFEASLKSRLLAAVAAGPLPTVPS